MASIAVPAPGATFPAPETANPQELSRSSSSAQPNFESLVNTPVSSHPDESQASEAALNRRPSSPNQTIQSILTATGEPEATPSALSSQAAWNSTTNIGHPSRDTHGVLSTPSTAPPRTSTKRKLDASEGDDPHNKIRRVVRDHVSQHASRPIPMTTVLCLHAAVAQKSYGTEKRFLCPPPIVHIEGPVWNMKNQQLSMTVVSEGGERSYEQRAPIDHNLSASFKFLHVTGSAKSKSFQLSLDIAEPPPPTTDGSEPANPGRVWASFDSAPVTIISKPSKKTAKTRNIASCILAGGPVSLFNRINSQTVRTKYMTVDNGQLCASNVTWAAFNVSVVRPQGEQPAIGPQPVTYGSEVILTDTLSGISTSPLTIRKVDKGRIAPDDGGPVSQMQKIALQRTNTDGTRHYLSAASPVPGQGATPGQTPANQTGTHPLVFQAPRVREETRDGVRVITDEVDDYLCWTIVGISKFQYTFFDAFGHTDPPELPITPFPTLFTAPALATGNGSEPCTLDLTVANFFYAHPHTREQTPLSIYLGNLGPLRHQMNAPYPPGPLTSVSPYVQAIGPDGVQRDEPIGSGASPLDRPPYMGAGPIHTSITVDLPPVADILRALQEDLEPPARDAPGPQNGASADPKVNVAALNGRSLPLLFIRAADGVGYHSGRAIAVENIFQSLEMNGRTDDQAWLAQAQGLEAAMHSWSLRVI
ncbi:uncharacterized protein PHACADRAFT_190379 [Phanerochaete carnosa HHB-10118-sp]|uniref:Beta-trefoil DNA-binding domain-containing protein n=1 Tax=Phanerochaete carnosa (strain HHB-10118-sp) TaxID=650164 RepID=K5WB91_PHACS|nr:uncharacterized protein PHACADRAFT_190379 [Phanerochaete carnosa HHB-10118-sp]EKM61228.1 hypothetical protein PHACADRAFT_190379 [Phanerochaete carnosa HHB-10118-sp]